MKQRILFNWSYIFLGFFSVLAFSACQNKKIEKVLNLDKAVCFRAIDGTDTAFMEIDTTLKRDVIGKLRFIYGDTNRYVGDFKGEINRDTLKGFFEFQLNGGEQWHRNPVSFLKNGSQWIMGEGKFILVWGSGYFDPNVPIDYSRSKFKFEPVACP